MIPLRDTNPTRTFPFITYALIIANILVFFFEVTLGKHLNLFVSEFGVVPARFVDEIHTAKIDVGTFFPFLSSMFLHGGWLHLLGNMLFLHIFGDNVEDKFGHFTFLLFYLFAGFVAAGTQVYMSPASQVPMVGASGAIAGVLGAFVFMFPRAKIATLIPIIFFFFKIIDLPAFVFIGFWFLLQVLSAVMALGIGADAGGVAWWAHIGGFAVGAISSPFLRKNRR
jgi:membrane associated rhomboid family serine protease